jgi:hypothetical protein
MSVPTTLSELSLTEVKKVIASMKELDSTLKGQHGTQPGDPRNVTDLDALQAWLDESEKWSKETMEIMVSTLFMMGSFIYINHDLGEI